MKKIERYHRDVYFPDWFDKSAKDFIEEISSNSPITFSFHALDKTIDSVSEYGKQILKFIERAIKRNEISADKIFEFYATREENIRKACFRYSYEEFPVDIILVISHDAVAVTVYLTNKDDNHRSMNKKPYKKRERSTES